MEDICLRCTLPICDQRIAAGCQYLIQITRKSRSEYFKARYQRNREKMIADQTRRNKARVETGEYAEYHRKWRKRKKEERLQA